MNNEHYFGVSVCVFTYNYENYLAQALESVLSQQTDFPVEIIIGDDFSTDATREIALSYYNRYPNQIVLSFNQKNLGGTENWIKAINRARGKYVALLDGDDYFTDRGKLQKQHDLMEADIDVVLCFHAVEEVYEDVEGKNQIVRFEKQKYILRDFLSRGWFVRTGSTMFRNGLFPEPMPEWVFDFPYRFDTILHVFLGLKGHALYIDEVMSVWRKHQKGLSKQLMSNMVKNIQTEIALAQQLDRYTLRQGNDVVERYCALQYSRLLVHLAKNGLWVEHIDLLPRSILKADWKEILKSLKRKLGK
jgi:glycosyltransferase involved in cell wall biosynthesis